MLFVSSLSNKTATFFLLQGIAEEEVGNFDGAGNEGTSGLVNFGNTCFLNAAIQALANDHPFANELLALASGGNLPKVPGEDEKVLVTPLLASTISAMWRSRAESVAPFAFFEEVGRVPASIFGDPRVQQDTSEFLQWLIDRLATETGGSGTPSFIENVMELQQRSLVTCETCSNPSSAPVFAPLTILNAPVAAHSLFGCIESYFRREDIDDYDCSICMSHQPASKIFTLTELPATLVVQLGRFSFNGNGSKNSARVGISTDIDLEPFVSENDGDTETETRYNLRSVVVHLGDSLESGHYITVLFAPDGSLVVKNDTKTRTVRNPSEKKDLMNDILTGGFLFFYGRQNRAEKTGDYNADVAELETYNPIQLTSLIAKIDRLKHVNLKAALAAKFTSNADADRELRRLRREIRSADDEGKAKYRPHLLALVEIVRDRSETKSAGGIDDEDDDSDDEHVEVSTGRSSKSGSARASKTTLRASKKTARASKAGGGGSEAKTNAANRKFNSKGNPLRNDNAGSCEGDHVYNVNDNDAAAANAVPVITGVKDQRKAMRDNLAVCSGIEQCTAKLIDDATDDLQYKQVQKDVGQGQAQFRGSASFTNHNDDRGGTRSTDHSTKAKKSIDKFVNSMKQFLIKHGMDPEDEGLVDAYSILFQRGGGMGLHPDAAKKDYPHLHFVRLVFSRGGSGTIDFVSHFFETGDGRATQRDPNHQSPITIATEEGYHVYGMSALMSGMYALCWTNEERTRGIQQKHRVNTIPLDGNQRANIVVTAPFRKWENVEKVLAAINGELFSLFPDGPQLEATDGAKQAAVDAVNRKDVVLCESDEVNACEFCSNGQAVTALRPTSGGGERGSCPPIYCGSCVAQKVENKEHVISDFIPPERYPMDCQCGRDKVGNCSSCHIHFGEEKKCLGCKKKGCYREWNWCYNCIANHVPRKETKCLGCKKKGCYRLRMKCRDCLGIGICAKCKGDKEAGNKKYCDACEPLCKVEGCTNERRSHLKGRAHNQRCSEHSLRRGQGTKHCAKCGGDKGKGNSSKWCPSCKNICKICDAVLTAERKKKKAGRGDYCSNEHWEASRKK